MHIIIDGYNLIRQSDTLRRFERFSLEEGRNQLIRRLVEYKKNRGYKITVVFDGWIDGSFREEHLREGGIGIIYSRQGEKADEVIKRLTEKGGSETVVVTSDRAVADAAVKSGGVAISSPEFEMKMAIEQMDCTLLDDALEDDDASRTLSTKKKGPARRLSKRKRVTRRTLKKL